MLNGVLPARSDAVASNLAISLKLGRTTNMPMQQLISEVACTYLFYKFEPNCGKVPRLGIPVFMCCTIIHL